MIMNFFEDENWWHAALIGLLNAGVLALWALAGYGIYRLIRRRRRR